MISRPGYAVQKLRLVIIQGAGGWARIRPGGPTPMCRPPAATTTGAARQMLVVRTSRSAGQLSKNVAGRETRTTIMYRQAA